VKKGDDVTLHTDYKIQRSDQIRWMFGDKNLIAEIKEGTGEIATYDDDLDGRFRGRLKLDEQTGSLTITNFRTEHTGPYKMKINRSAEKSKNKINTNFSVKGSSSLNSVKKGEPIILVTGAKIEEDDQIQWIFEDGISIAEITERKKRFDYADERFRGKLELDIRTGDLTIIDSTVQHAGRYKLMINKVPYETFIVVVKGESLQSAMTFCCVCIKRYLTKLISDRLLRQIVGYQQSIQGFKNRNQMNVSH
uniref:Immunoglobulin V-set domain-containing protein n=1 Tax=Sinocyclocheilus rhinocerous TaxID=307959 RepID=A0A673KAX2_9TELE